MGGDWLGPKLVAMRLHVRQELKVGFIGSLRHAMYEFLGHVLWDYAHTCYF